jgi:hypothetical protein
MLKLIIVTACLATKLNTTTKIKANDSIDLLRKMRNKFKATSYHSRLWNGGSVVSMMLIDFAAIPVMQVNRITAAMDKIERTLLAIGFTSEKFRILSMLLTFTERTKIISILNCTNDTIQKVLKELATLLNLKDNNEKSVLYELYKLNINNE